MAKTADPLLIRPPGALAEEEFLGRCVRCGECMKVCIGNALHPTFLEAGLAGMFSPLLIARLGYCEFNLFVAKALTLVDHPAFRRFIDELFPAVARMIETMGPPIIRLMVALANAATAALPTVQLLIGKLGGFIDAFTTWIEDAIADGRFQQFLDDAIASAQSIWDLVKALIGLFAEMFMQTDEGGRKFLEKITQAINKFTVWLKSPEGKKALAEAVVLALAFAEAFALALGIIKVVVTELSRAVGIATALLRLLGIIEAKKNPGTGLAAGAQAGVNQFAGGGMMRGQIPSFRLPVAVLDEEVNYILGMGLIESGPPIGPAEQSEWLPARPEVAEALAEGEPSP